MDKINQFFNQFGLDKYVHLVISVLIFIPVNLAFGPIWGVVAGTVFNIIKQAWDLYTKSNTPHQAMADMWAGAIGSLLAWMCTLNSSHLIWLVSVITSAPV